MDTAITFLGVFVVTLLGVFALSVLGGLIVAPFVMWGWNFVMPFVFGLPTITYWHGFWMYFLANMLIKSTQTNTNNAK